MADIVQVILIYVGIIFVAFPMTLNHIGGFSTFWSQLPENMTNVMGMDVLDILAILLANFLGAFVLQNGFQMAIASRQQQ